MIEIGILNNCGTKNGMDHNRLKKATHKNEKPEDCAHTIRHSSAYIHKHKAKKR
ncbi:hypothetical protein CHCC20335_3689 [Bacillus paralicheniformis]|nr:hypothetical protein CHCC20335_3689 [Bacillus paralicheniformis]